MKGVGDEAVQVVVQEAPDRAKAEYVVARHGTLVAAVGDEELVLDPATPSEKQAPLKLTRDEKMTKLAAWLERRQVARYALSSPPAFAPPSTLRRVKQSSGKLRWPRARRVASMNRVVTGSW